MTQRMTIAELLRADPNDIGCEQGFALIGEYVDLEVAGADAAARFPGLAVHLATCPACRLDHDGILHAARVERGTT